MLRLRALEPAVDGAELLALQHTSDRLDLLDRQPTEIGDRALPDALSLAHAFAQQVGRARLAVRYDIDVHGVLNHALLNCTLSHSSAVHGYNSQRSKSSIA